MKGVDDERLSTGLAGVIGVTAAFALGAGLVVLVRRSRSSDCMADGPT